MAAPSSSLHSRGTVSTPQPSTRAHAFATRRTALNPLNGPPSPFILHEVELNWSQLGVCEDWCADEVKLNRTPAR